MKKIQQKTNNKSTICQAMRGVTPDIAIKTTRVGNAISTTHSREKDPLMWGKK